MSEYIAKNARTLAIRRAIIAEAKAAGCADCGEMKMGLLEFDHVPERGPKSFNIANGSQVGIEALRAEIGKCQIRCRACHILITARRSREVAATRHDIREAGKFDGLVQTVNTLAEYLQADHPPGP